MNTKSQTNTAETVDGVLRFSKTPQQMMQNQVFSFPTAVHDDTRSLTSLGGMWPYVQRA